MSMAEHGANVIPMHTKRIESFFDWCTERGVQPVQCRTERASRPGAKDRPVPLSGTTGRRNPYGVVKQSPRPSFDRLAFRPPPGALVLDVDRKDGVDGSTTLARAEADLGFLPDTQRLTSRGAEQSSGRMLFRVPFDLETRHAEAWLCETYGGGIDVLISEYRFCMAPGDYNPNSGGSVVECYGPDGAVEDMSPVAAWPMLPADWVDAIRDHAERQEYAQSDPGATVTVGTSEGAGMIARALESIREHADSGQGAEYRLTLMRKAELLGGFVGTLLTEREFEERLHAAVYAVWGSEPDDDEAELISSGLERGQERPFVIADGHDFDDGFEDVDAPVPDRTPIDEIEIPEPSPKLVRQRLLERVSREAADRIFEASRMAEEIGEGETGVDVGDIDAFLSGDVSTTGELPELMVRTDGIGLVYRGKSHTFSGEPGSGKSMIVQTECVAEMHRGGHVVYVDYEDSLSGVASRMLLLGATREQLKTQFSYIRPKTAMMQGIGHEGFRSNILRRDAGVIVIDGVTSALRMEGLDHYNSRDVDDWFGNVVQPMEATGAAVLMVDHVVKNEENRGRYAIGSERKLGAITGAAYQVNPLEPLRPGKVGKLLLVLAKDRVGAVAEHCGTVDGAASLKAAIITVDSTGDTPVFTIDPAGEPTQTAPSAVRETRREKALERKQDRVKVELMKHWENNPNNPEMSKSELVAAIGGRRAEMMQIVDSLAESGEICLEQLGQKLLYTMPEDTDYEQLLFELTASDPKI